MRDKKKRLYIVGLILLVAIGGLYYFMFGASNNGEILDNKPDSKKDTSVSAADKQLTGRHVQLTYRGIYLPFEQPAKEPDLESYQLKASTTYVKQIVVIVSKLPDGQLNQNSAYILRSNRTDLYKKRMVTVNGRPVEVWVSVDGQEQTAFIKRNDKVAMLVFAQRGGDVGELNAEVSNLLQSLTWR